MRAPVPFRSLTDQHGTVLVLVAMAMLFIAGLLGMAIDLGFSYGVKGQLQAAADASAVAGADHIYPANSSTPPSGFPTPRFTEAKTQTVAFVKRNKVAGAALTDADIVSIETGYWNLKGVPSEIRPTITPTGVCSKSGGVCNSSEDCSAEEACMVENLPAVQVTVRKKVPTFFGRVVGFDELNPQATATAAIGYPQTAKSYFPVAVTRCMVETYFKQNPMPSPPPLLQIGAPYGPGGAGCSSGQWTSLNAEKNDVPTMLKLMYGTAPLPPLAVGDGIWIDTGAKDALFQAIQKDFIGKVVKLPVVADASVSTNSKTPVTGFVYFKILGTSSNSPKQLLGNFVSYYKEEGPSTPGGPRYNGVTRPMLVR